MALPNSAPGLIVLGLFRLGDYETESSSAPTGTGSWTFPVSSLAATGHETVFGTGSWTFGVSTPAGVGHLDDSNRIRPSAWSWVRFIPEVTLISTVAPGSGFSIYTVFVNGADATNYVRVGGSGGPGIKIDRQINSKGTCSFTTLDKGGSFIPVSGDDVAIYENGSTLIFAGSIDSTTERHVMGHNSTTIETQVKCTDFGIICDRRIVGRSYANLNGVFGTASTIAQDIIARDLAGTGITWVNTGVDGLTGEIIFNYVTVTEAFNQLAKAAQSDWRIDEHGNFRFFSVAQDAGFLPAPASFNDSVKNWESITVGRTRTRFANRVIAKSSRSLGALWTDSFHGRPLGAYLTQYGLSTTPDVFINGTSAIVFELTALNTLADAPPAYDFYWNHSGGPGTNGQGVWYNPTKTPLLDTDIVTVTYPSPLPFVGIAQDQTSIDDVGLFEAIIEAGDIPDKDQLQAIADNALARGIEEVDQVTAVTKTGGFAPGQKVNINIAHPLVDDDFVIETVSSQEIGQSFMRHTITASSSQYQRTGSPANYMGTIIARGRTPVDRVIQTITFNVAGTIEGFINPGLTTGLKSGIKSAQKPGVAGWATLRFKSVDDGTPTIADISIDVYKNGTSIFAPADKLFFPAGTSEVKEWRFTSDPLKVNAGDVFTFEVLAADSLAKDGILELVLLG